MTKKEENMKKKEDKIFETSQFHTAVWLQMNGILLEEIVWNEKRAIFVFKDFKDREALIQDFFKQKQLQSYISGAQETKARMYASRTPVEYKR